MFRPKRRPTRITTRVEKQSVNMRLGRKQYRATFVTVSQGRIPVDRWVVIEAPFRELVLFLYGRIRKIIGKCRLVM